jgi:sulfur-carrier protein
MATIRFTRQLLRHVPCPERTVDAADLRGALESYFVEHPRVRGYVLDEQGCLRKHVVVFIDGVQAKDRTRLSDPLTAASEIDVMQALSGG